MSPLQSKVIVKPLPTYVCKAMWAGTAVTYLIEAKNEEKAKEKCWNQITHTMGGDLCLRVDIIERRD